MVESQDVSESKLIPPWGSAALSTPQGIVSAQEYWFQNYGTHSQMVAEGRNAVGFVKGSIRRKLEREMGEDFKLYTGQNLGTVSEGPSKGIRGDLNSILETVYQKVAPGRPIESPAQEDAVILSHPLGGLEVCYAISFFYQILLQRYATLASSKRKVLKAVLDEEVFKWVWRLTQGMLLSTENEKLNFSSSLLSTGLPGMPPKAQQATTSEKVVAIADFLMSKSLSTSHLRFALVFYFNIYCRHIHQSLLMATSRQEIEKKYDEIVKQDPEKPISNMFVAIDVIMNKASHSGQSFEDILNSEDQEVEKYIPQAEIDFLEPQREFSISNLSASLKKIIPRASELGSETGRTSLMPLLLVLRILPSTIQQLVLDKLPGPFLNIFSIRIRNTTEDEVAHALLDKIKATIEERTLSGETYTVSGSTRRKKSVGVETVRPASKAKAPAALTMPAASEFSSASTPPTAASQRVAKDNLADTLNQPVIFDWKIEQQGLKTETLTPHELIKVAGKEIRILLRLIKFAMQTGQVFQLPPEKVSRQTMEYLVAHTLQQVPGEVAPLLTEGERQGLLETSKALDTKRLLAILADKLPGRSTDAGLNTLLQSVAEKVGAPLPELLKNPRDASFRESLSQLSGKERQMVAVLNRVAQVS